MKNSMILFILICLVLSGTRETRSQIASPDEIRFYTLEWEGERLPDGRPKLPQDLMERLKNISIEEVWGVLRGEGYLNQFEGGWKILHKDQPFTGQALTALYMPKRPEYADRLLEKGHEEGMKGAMNSWPIDLLIEGDVYVADCFGKVVDGTLIGDNLGNAIYTNSKRGVVFDAGSRDLEGLGKIEGFNAFVRGWDPTYLTEVMLTGVNVPIKIGNATVFPGDAVLAKEEGVIFIPPHLLEKVVITAEFIALKDNFGHQRLKEGKYTPGEIDGRWSDAIKEDFLEWLDEHPDLLPMTREELDNYLKNRTW
ncbi:MAG: dimethylmenaquinone methyltransferase [Bacteroides sp. SM23_62]|nr:MAG: dimethylmenaquinone methyltransferase [Bacteroides sp. SM23_62]